MSEKGEILIERLPLQSELRNEDNPMRKILLNTIGEWLERYNVDEWFKQHFLNEATGKYLDLHGKQFNIKRKENEDDEKYRERIKYIIIGHLTIPYLKNIYNIKIFNKPENYTDGYTLLSDNEYYLESGNNIDIMGYYGMAEEEIKELLNKKFIINSGITWLED